MPFRFIFNNTAQGLRQVATPAAFSAAQLVLARTPQHGTLGVRAQGLYFTGTGYDYLAAVLRQQGPRAVVTLQIDVQTASGTWLRLHEGVVALEDMRLEAARVAVVSTWPSQALRLLHLHGARAQDLLSGLTLEGQPLASGSLGTGVPCTVATAGSPSVPTVPALEALSRTAQAATANGLSAVSEYLGRVGLWASAPAPTTGQDGPAAPLHLSTAAAVRGRTQGIWYDGFNHVFSVLKALYALGYGLEATAGAPVLRVEPLRFFYDDSATPLTLALPAADGAALVQQPAPELAWQQVALGLRPAPVALAGADPVLGRRYQALTVETPAAVLDLQTDALASRPQLEYLLQTANPALPDVNDPLPVLLLGTPAADAASPTGYRLVQQQGVVQAQNLPSPATQLAWPLTPWHVYVRWWPWLGAGFRAPAGVAARPLPGRGAAGATAAQAQAVSYSLRQRRYAEPTALHDEDVTLSGLATFTDAFGLGYPQPVLRPERLQAQLMVPLATWQQLTLAPYAPIRLTLRGATYALGYLHTARYLPESSVLLLTLTLAQG